ncbi:MULTISPECIES: diaminopropionate ammonia-lyase [Kordiimonas]|jgi:diaminopropionate ammonia-lyase|uniref:diaminopropionate ammonia-lyase n=1 Tax=Kordiimonas TaxID=288021 RepID=UPI00257DE539|nr:diaminopropionate ammonia-lyase [Kordiimonas sp. UBA4487]
MLLLNNHPNSQKALPNEIQQAFTEATCQDVIKSFRAVGSELNATPLHQMHNLADEFGVASIAIKDEAHRLGLGSFKALGGAYAVFRHFEEKLGALDDLKPDQVTYQNPTSRAIAAAITVACATDGNHGKSVAYGAKKIGARAHIFLHRDVNPERADAIAQFGAKLHYVDGTYDDAIKYAETIAKANGWSLISDTSWPGYEEVPLTVMQGYTILAQEMLQHLQKPPTHVFLQAGVGGMAAAISAFFKSALGERCPKIIVVEPESAACIQAGIQQGSPHKVSDETSTVMAMLECYEPSHLAWKILTHTATATLSIEDEAAINALRLLAKPYGNDPHIVSGESGGAGLAGFLQVASNPDHRKVLGIDHQSRILAINTEGATAPKLYADLLTNHSRLSDVPEQDA